MASARVAFGTSVSCKLLVALPWVSISTSSTRAPRRTSSPARLMADVVLPVPPFWFITAMVFIPGPPFAPAPQCWRPVQGRCPKWAGSCSYGAGPPPFWCGCARPPWRKPAILPFFPAPSTKPPQIRHFDIIISKILWHYNITMSRKILPVNVVKGKIYFAECAIILAKKDII